MPKYTKRITMCPPGYHHNGFMATPELGHRMLYIYIYIYIYKTYNNRTIPYSKINIYICGQNKWLLRSK